MNNSKNKKSFSDYIKKLNEIDINDLIASIQKINFKDLKEIDIKELIIKIRKSPIFMPTIGLLSASTLFSFLLVPSFDQLLKTFRKANQYKNESSQIQLNKNKISKIEQRINKSVLEMNEINKSIISKSDIIFISNLVNEAAKSSDVEITSILPIRPPFLRPQHAPLLLFLPPRSIQRAVIRTPATTRP